MESESTSELIRSQLRRLRLNADLSQEEFGKLVHYSGSQVSAVELGHRPLDRLFLERRLGVRMDRQAVLTKPNPPKLVAVVEETVLRRADEGFRGIMTQQIAHLIECGERANVSVHVVPADVSGHVGLAGPFTLARQVDGGWVGYLENQLDGTSIDRDDEIAILQARWESVRSEALPHGQSAVLMKEVMMSWTI
ncbi:helix-turn-helix domain-containing protein [Micromonospora sp. SH-82]|uniref:helix-turn-helix domain-containing protein n=1 Tax=Micromonospora sp. SH-82 TaxID=3132938 RepID=UPI003EB9A834